MRELQMVAALQTLMKGPPVAEDNSCPTGYIFFLRGDQFA